MMESSIPAAVDDNMLQCSHSYSIINLPFI